jgi:cell division protein FtsN
MVAWTTVLALVFSAGLITGQRMLKRQALPPLVSLSSAQAAEAPAEGGQAEGADEAAAEAAGGAEKDAKKDAKKDVKKDGLKDAKAAAKPAADGKKDMTFSFYETLSGEAGGEQAPAPQANPKQAVAEAAKQVVAEQAAKKIGADAALPARYTLQAGAHASMDRAKVQMDKLTASALEPHLIVVEGAEGAKVYKVRVGKFHSMDEARHFQGSIKERGVDTFVTPL